MNNSKEFIQCPFCRERTFSINNHYPQLTTNFIPALIEIPDHSRFDAALHCSNCGCGMDIRFYGLARLKTFLVTMGFKRTLEQIEKWEKENGKRD